MREITSLYKYLTSEHEKSWLIITFTPLGSILSIIKIREYLCSRLCKITYKFIILRKYLPMKVLRTVYYTLFQSVGGLVAQAVRRSPPAPPLASRVRVSVTPCGFRGGRNEVWVGFSRGFSRFPLPQNFIPPFLHTHLIHFVSFHSLLWWCVRRGRPAPLLLTDL